MKRVLSDLVALTVFGVCIFFTVEQDQKLPAPTSAISNVTSTAS